MSKRLNSGDDSHITIGLREHDVFITEYITENHFTGILKERFSDFQVYEVDENGLEIHLTSLDKSHLNSGIVKSVDNDGDDLEDINVEDVPPEILTYPLDNQWKYLALLSKRNKRDECIKINVNDLTKEDRKNLHSEIFLKYNGILHTRTDTIENIIYVIVSTNKNNEFIRNAWPKDTPEYLHFVLYKENIDTMSAVRQLCSMIKVNQKLVSYAGTKDKRAVTSQRIAVRKVNHNRLNSFKSKKIWLGNFEYKSEQLQLGQLRGNRFVVALRNVTSSDDIINETMVDITKHGFINYFGLQRFGSYSNSPTFGIGKNILQENWEKAIDLFLTYHPESKEISTQQAVKLWNETKNAKATVRLLKKYDCSTEAIILKTLANQGNTAYINALQKLPRNVVLLCLHSFQSIVWNEIVSRRIKEFGMKVLPGDLVLSSDLKDVPFETVDDDEVEGEEEKISNVQVISEEEVHKYTIYDIVYPFPGHAIELPRNSIAEWYKEILSRYGVEDFKCRNKMFSLTGAYRKLLVVPENVQWKIVYHNNPTADLISTDLQKLNNEENVENFENGELKAVILELTLPSCTYATMAFREITKTDSSSFHQASLTQDHYNSKRIKIEESSNNAQVDESKTPVITCDTGNLL